MKDDLRRIKITGIRSNGPFTGAPVSGKFWTNTGMFPSLWIVPYGCEDETGALCVQVFPDRPSVMRLLDYLEKNDAGEYNSVRRQFAHTVEALRTPKDTLINKSKPVLAVRKLDTCTGEGWSVMHVPTGAFITKEIFFLKKYADTLRTLALPLIDWTRPVHELRLSDETNARVKHLVRLIKMWACVRGHFAWIEEGLAKSGFRNIKLEDGLMWKVTATGSWTYYARNREVLDEALRLSFRDEPIVEGIHYETSALGSLDNRRFVLKGIRP